MHPNWHFPQKHTQKSLRILKFVDNYTSTSKTQKLLHLKEYFKKIYNIAIISQFTFGTLGKQMRNK